MTSKKIKLALISPELQAETFIMAHKQLLPFEVHHYYGGGVPAFSEKNGALIKPGMKGLLQSKSRNAFFLNNTMLSTAEKAVARSFSENNIKVVLAEYGTTAARMLNICEAMRIPMIVYFFGYDAWVQSTIEKFGDAYKRVFEYAYKVFAVSKSIQQKLIELGCPAQKIVYSVCAPRDDFFSIITSPKEDLALATGRFVDKKAPYYTILAFKKVLAQIPTAKLIMCGDGPLWDVCKNMIAYYDLQENILLPGRITQQQSIQYLSGASMFVQHSITAKNGDKEGTPVAILEAAAAGIPVVSTLHSGIPEIVDNGITGLLVNEHDVDAMAEKMIYLFTHKEEALKMGAAARRNVQQNFSMQQHIDALAIAIESAVINNKEIINA